MKILVICGSSRERSRTRVVTTVVRNILADTIEEILFFDTRTNPLPLFSGAAEEETHPEIKRLRSFADQADGFIICTPDYHNGMSGSLKNALDFLGGQHFRGKPSTMISIAGGGKGGINALNNLRLVLRGVYALVLPEQLVIDGHQIDLQQETIDKGMQERLESQLNQFIQITEKLQTS